jgi:hypothetical protein
VPPILFCSFGEMNVPGWWRSAGRGAVAVLVVFAVVVPITCLRWTELALFAAIIVGLNVGLWAGRDSGLASFAGALLMASLGVVVALFTEVQVIGPNAGPIAIKDISSHRAAASFHFADARVATEFAGTTAKRTVFGAPTGSWRAAPIVPSDWTPSDPVPAWAIAEISGFGPHDFRTPRNWQQAHRAGVRYVLTQFAPARRAVAEAIERYHLVASPHAPLLYWVEEPRAIIAGERAFLAWVMFGGIAAWVLFLLGEMLLVAASAATSKPAE